MLIAHRPWKFAFILLVTALIAPDATRAQAKSDLEALAREFFADLSDAEAFVARCVEDVGNAVLIPDTSPFTPEAPAYTNEAILGIDMTEAGSWGPDRTLRASFLQWLLTSAKVKPFIGHEGVSITGARVAGDLDLSFSTMSFPVGFVACLFERPISARQAEMKVFALSKSVLPGLSADRIQVAGNFSLDAGFHATGHVRFCGARIGGQLKCDDATFENPSQWQTVTNGEDTLIGGDALSADGAQVGGNVVLADGFHAIGEVRLLGASIGDQLNCRNAFFENPLRTVKHRDGKTTRTGGSALNADGIKVAGYVLLRTGFHAKGEVRFSGAVLDGSLFCEDATFENPNGTALSASGLQARGDLFIRDKTLIVGRVDLSSVRIEGFFQWRGLKEPSAASLDLRGGRIGGMWFGRIDQPAPGALFLNGLVYSSLDEETPSDARWWIDLIEKQVVETPQSLGAEAKTNALATIEGQVERSRLFIPQPYEQAARALREQGHVEDAKEILIARELRRRVRIHPFEAWKLAVGEPGEARVGFIEGLTRFVSLSTQWLWLYVFGRFVGYGHRPSIAGWCAGVWILITFGLAHFGRRNRLIVPSQSWGWPKECAERPAECTFYPTTQHPAYPEFQPLIFALETFTPLVKLRQAEFWQADSRNRWGNVLRWFFWFTTVLGWGTTILLTAALSGILKK